MMDNTDSGNTKPNIVFKRNNNANDYNWTIDRDILKKIYEDIDGDATMGDIEQVLLSVEKYQKEFFKDE